MAQFSFAITEDRIHDPRFDVISSNLEGKIVGNKSSSYKEIVANGDQFVIKDADDEIYYKGCILNKYDGFEPLDCVGRGAGATKIFYKEKGVWEEL